MKVKFSINGGPMMEGEIVSFGEFPPEPAPKVFDAKWVDVDVTVVAVHTVLGPIENFDLLTACGYKLDLVRWQWYRPTNQAS